MSPDESEELRQWVARWQAAGPGLAAIGRRELQSHDTQQALLNLADVFEACRLHSRPRLTSGLVEQQALFQRLRR